MEGDGEQGGRRRARRLRTRVEGRRVRRQDVRRGQYERGRGRRWRSASRSWCSEGEECSRPRVWGWIRREWWSSGVRRLWREDVGGRGRAPGEGKVGVGLIFISK
ncbi:hypothetical protein ACS0TY_016614 [Phlomoides rotata]